MLVEGGVDAAQDGFEGNAGLAPGLDQRPVEGGEHKDGAASLLEAGLDLGEVVEVVHKAVVSCELVVVSWGRGGASLGAFLIVVGRWIPEAPKSFYRGRRAGRRWREGRDCARR